MKFIRSERSFEWWVIAVSALVTGAATAVFLAIYLVVRPYRASTDPTYGHIGFVLVAIGLVTGLVCHIAWQRWRQHTGPGAAILPFQRRRRS
jgi:hypothetical protein